MTGKLYGWGRGFSSERGIDVSRSRPSMIERIEKRHCFLVSAENKQEDDKDQLGNVQVDLPKTYTKAVEVVDLELIQLSDSSQNEPYDRPSSSTKKYLESPHKLKNMTSLSRL